MNQEAENPTPEAGLGIPPEVEMAKDIRETLGDNPDFTEPEEYEETTGNLGDEESLDEPIDTPSVEEEPQEETVEMLTIGGKEYSAAEIEEWRLGNMREKDYRQKTMKIAERERKVEATERMLDEMGISPYSPSPQSAYQQPPQPYQFAVPQTPEGEFVDQQVAALRDQVQQQGQVLNNLQRQNEVNQMRGVKQNVDRADAEFRSWYQQETGDEATPELMESVYGTMNRYDMKASDSDAFKAAYRSSLDIEQMRKTEREQAVAEYVAAKKKDKSAAVEPSTAPAGEPPKPDARKMTEEEIFKAAVAEIK